MGADRVASAPAFAGLSGTAPRSLPSIPADTFAITLPERGVRRSQQNFSNQPTEGCETT